MKYLGAAAALIAPLLFAGGSSLYPGDTLAIRVTQELNSGRNSAGTRFQGTVETAVVQNGKELIPKGALVDGYIHEAATSGRATGRSELQLHLDGLTVNGRRYSITTQPEVQTGGSHRTHNTKYIGGGAFAGIIIGAIAGGGKGAAVGALSGAAVGGAGAVATGKKEIQIPAETVLTFRIRDQVILD